ncbi:MAG: hypothetical protein GXP59_09320 [Deltaproteobacteria bacterium]|nr:hypothetical protein [Deltaproteobacteria bacterium]
MSDRLKGKGIRCGLFVLGLLLYAEPALAVQHHGGAEGLISHQIGHILFTLGMAFLLFRVYQDRKRGAGWFEFKGFLWCIILWNIMTFTGHWLDELTSPASFTIVNQHPVAFTINNLQDALFYFTRLDHLLLLPALFFLLKALQKWGKA